MKSSSFPTDPSAQRHCHDCPLALAPALALATRIGASTQPSPLFASLRPRASASLARLAVCCSPRSARCSLPACRFPRNCAARKRAGWVEVALRVGARAHAPVESEPQALSGRSDGSAATLEYDAIRYTLGCQGERGDWTVTSMHTLPCNHRGRYVIHRGDEPAASSDEDQGSRAR